MKRIYLSCVALICIALHSCQTVNITQIDYLVPSEVSFPDQIKRVAIVNNVAELPGRIPENAAADSVVLKATNGFLERYTLNGNAQIAAESLAEAVAAENYFDEVVICDSVLQVVGTPKEELTPEGIRRLTKSLDVDMLITLEDLKIKVQRRVYSIGLEAEYLGVVDVKVQPEVSLYIANRPQPLVIIYGNDSIFWEGYSGSVLGARTKVVTDEQLVDEASDFAGTIPVKYMTPHWETRNRFYFTNGSSLMRDAAYFVQSNDWDKAFALWERAYESSKGKKKALVASNISLYYEMTDDLEKAEEWGEKALALIGGTTAIGQEEAIAPTGDYARIHYNQADLLKRKSLFTKLKTQMNRFNDDF